jgi:hypothetical protein
MPKTSELSLREYLSSMSMPPVQQERLEKLFALPEKWRPDEEDLMEYDGDNHGDTAEAAYNRCLKARADELEQILGEKP